MFFLDSGFSFAVCLCPFAAPPPPPALSLASRPTDPVELRFATSTSAPKPAHASAASAHSETTSAVAVPHGPGRSLPAPAVFVASTAPPRSANNDVARTFLSAKVVVAPYKRARASRASRVEDSIVALALRARCSEGGRATARGQKNQQEQLGTAAKILTTIEVTLFMRRPISERLCFSTHRGYATTSTTLLPLFFLLI